MQIFATEEDDELHVAYVGKTIGSLASIYYETEDEFVIDYPNIFEIICSRYYIDDTRFVWEMYFNGAWQYSCQFHNPDKRGILFHLFIENGRYKMAQSADSFCIETDNNYPFAFVQPKKRSLDLRKNVLLRQHAIAHAKKNNEYK